MLDSYDTGLKTRLGKTSFQILKGMLDSVLKEIKELLKIVSNPQRYVR